jgi:hypothetical protein
MNPSFARPRPVTLLLVTLLLALGYGSAPVLAQAVDPQSLVGEWTGQWSSTSRAQVSGPYSMVISKVDGDKVTGRVERSTQQKNVSFAFVGTLEGNKLIIDRPGSKTELEISDNQMRGGAFGTYRGTITLNKK